jgi:3-hydroxyisobutyrate dehydrogenase-like beta-hydroxyacid dehydrogenase
LQATGANMSRKVGFIGLGTMGGAMAANLQKAGHRLVVHDINRKSADAHVANGAAWAETPMAAADAEVIFVSLPTPSDVESVTTRADGLLAGISPGTAVFDLSTNSLATVRKLEMLFRDKESYFLDAPISGGPTGAVSGKLALWVSGDRAVFDRFKPVLDAMGDQVSHVGEIGTGTIAKLVHNLSGQAVYAILAEAFTLGVKAGLEPRALYDIVSQGLVGLRRTFDGMPPILAGKFDPPPPVFALRLAHKDVALATALGRELGVPMRLSNLVLEEMTEALGRGWGGRACPVATLLQMERSGASLIVPPKEET